VSKTIRITLLATLFLTAPGVHADLSLTRLNGVIGRSLDYQLQGDPGEFFALFPSFTNGPTPLAVLDPRDPRVLGVGFDLISTWRYGLLDGTGRGTVIFPLPAAITVVGVPLYAQAVTGPGLTTTVDDVSNATVFKFSVPGGSNFAIGSVPDESEGHSSTLLADGRVLSAGGNTPVLGEALRTLVFYDPNTESFSTSPTRLIAGRIAHTATLLADGRVLFVGGTDVNGTVLDTAEVFDPVTETISAAPRMSVPRTMNTATLLADGRVFVAGGTSLFDALDILGSLAAGQATSEIYDPVTNSWASGPSLPKSRAVHAASLLQDGRVLITGGLEVVTILGLPIPSITAECRFYDPSSNAIVDAPDFSGDRALHAQVTLSDGSVLVGGGASGDFLTLNFTVVSTCRLFNPVSNAWTNVASMATPRAYLGLVETAQGVVAIGGILTLDLLSLSGLPAPSIERATPGILSWSPAGSMLFPRELTQNVPIDGGTRILTTGFGDNGSAATIPDLTVEIYAP